MTRILGVDPGLSGAIAVFDGGDLVSVYDMPTLDITKGKTKRRELDAANLARTFGLGVVDHVFVEQVGAMPRQGVSSTFSFGKSYGIIIGILAALQIPMTLVTPQKWKKALQLGSDKEVSRRRALQLWPQHAELFKLKTHADRAEAALIAEWGRLQ